MQRLARRTDGGVFIKVFRDGDPAVVFTREATGTVVRLTPELSFDTSGARLRSVSYGQRPDITVEVLEPGESPRLLLFDPKYKLMSEEDAEPGDGRPTKIDIDTMHAYRDAIRDHQQQRVVDYAAILYPGPETRYGDGIEAL